MTVPLENYEPVEVAINTAREYRFPWKWVGDDSIEVFEISINGDRRLVAIQDYLLTTDTNPRSPVKEGGLVTFNRPHRNDVFRVSIQRNTLIVSNLDMPTFQPISMQMIEFALDKLTLIMQEMVKRKCAAFTSTPITQNQLFGAYQQLRGTSIKAALDKAYQIALEIDESADDCFNRPENTGGNSVPGSPGGPTLPPDPEEPVDPPITPDPDPPDNVVEDFGFLDQLDTFRRDLFLTPGKTYSWGFQIDPVGTVPVIFYTILPQNFIAGTYRHWVSETPGGPPVDDGDRQATADYFGRIGGVTTIATDIAGRIPGRKRGTEIQVSTQYYYNISLLSGGDPIQSFAFWQLGGNFDF